MNENAGIQRWYARQSVAHRITNEVGAVLAVNFDESLAQVDYGDGHPRWARLENLREVSG